MRLNVDGEQIDSSDVEIEIWNECLVNSFGIREDNVPPESTDDYLLRIRDLEEAKTLIKALLLGVEKGLWGSDE